MPLVSSSIPNLINGVSQQPAALRLASQAEQVINAKGTLQRTVGKFLIKRIIAVNNRIILGVVFPKGQKASTKNIFKGPVVLLCCLSTNLLYSV